MTKEWVQGAKIYLSFFESGEDRLRRDLLDPIIFSMLEGKDKKILDLGCGEGYLTRKLKQHGFQHVTGADVSADLVAEAKRQDTSGTYLVFDVVKHEPAFRHQFNLVIANMVLHDLPEPGLVFKKIALMLGAGGELIATILNPCYAYPVGIWKRQIRQFFQGEFEPALLIRDYFAEGAYAKTMAKGGEMRHYHWMLSTYLEKARGAGFNLKEFREPKVTTELENKYGGLFLTKQLSKVPLFLLLKFTK